MRDRDPQTRSPAARLLRALVPAALALTVAACGVFSQQPGDTASGDSDRQGVTVKVKNLAWQNIHVYAISGSSWESLGVLSTHGEETYELPRSLVVGRREIRLAADPVGSRHAFISDEIAIEPGDRVEWTIQDNLALSSVFVR